jgi:hypothetical protein
MAPETGKPRQDVLNKMAWQVTLEMKERTGRPGHDSKDSTAQYLENVPIPVI